MNTNSSRREFLKKAATFIGTLVIVPFAANSIAETLSLNRVLQDQKKTPRINPAFRILLLNDGRLELFTFQKPGSKISHYYSGFEASIILLIAENKPLDANLKELMNQYAISQVVCKNKIDLAMNEFEKKGIVYYGDLMIVKKSEISHE